MADYNSKRTGEQIEALLDFVAQGGTGGGGEVQKTTEEEIAAMGFTKNQGTVTGVKMNGVSKGSSGVVDLGTVITSHQDISGKQDKLVSGTNIKTINGESILGSGNLTIAGGDSEAAIVKPVEIYPQLNGDAIVYRIPAGKFCELMWNFSFDSEVTENSYYKIILEGAPSSGFDYDNLEYIGERSYAKSHILFVKFAYDIPVEFVVEGAEETYFASPDSNTINVYGGWAFEADVLYRISPVRLSGVLTNYGEILITASNLN